MVRDQRSMTGPRFHSTVEEIRAEWDRYAARRLAGWEGRSLTITGRAVAAYISAGRWVADCPWCNGGIACWAENPQGACLSCGHVYEVVFPSDREALETAVAGRPSRNQNWLTGETVADLLVENLVHDPFGRAPLVVRPDPVEVPPVEAGPVADVRKGR